MPKLPKQPKPDDAQALRAVVSRAGGRPRRSARTGEATVEWAHLERAHVCS